MIQDNSSIKRDAVIRHIVNEHKYNLSHRHAFVVHRPAMRRMLNSTFMLPVKRTTAACETKAECTTVDTASCEDSGDKQVQVIRVAQDQQCALLSKIMGYLTQYEDFLQVYCLASIDEIKRITQFNRSLLAFVLSHKHDFSSVPRDSLALSILLFSAEKSNINKNFFLKFITEVLQNKKISKISQLRKGKSYILLAPRVHSTPGIECF